ncbi:modification methylase FokI [bacterium (Candidatus Howlettbacteria) CG_4_10_14_0_8_um_filter_40_9]|nr:MAG: modification methylase FokI [bacterium (Candidatus Howlettbacteria) CG_4_10_14_0_8_um_filter_40_9]
MRYYGCKTKLLDYISDVVASLPVKKGATFFDIFSGTAAVGKHFKKLDYTVYSNDFLEFAHAFARCYIETNSKPRFANLKINEDVITYLNDLKGKVGFITKNYSPYGKNVRQYISVENAKKVDVIRETIESWKESKKISSTEYYYLITSLIDAINLVSNVTGTYAAYLKTWDARALKPMKLSHPKIIPSIRENKSFNEDANKLVSKYSVDILYLDPPYNARQFASNYFFLELIAEGWFKKQPEIYGGSGMRPYEHQKSDYSISRKAADALNDLVMKAKAKYILLSYNNEGIIPHEKIREILSKRGKVKVFEKSHRRYRAINQDGSNVVTKESLFLVKVEK